MTKRRKWSGSARLALFLKYAGECHICHGRIHVGEAWEVSHEIPLELGGADDDTNAKPAHTKCHRDHTRERDIPAIARAKRRERSHAGIRKSRTPIRGWKKFDGTPIRNPRA